jgi:hypothetical protein
MPPNTVMFYYVVFTYNAGVQAVARHQRFKEGLLYKFS